MDAGNGEAEPTKTTTEIIRGARVAATLLTGRCLFFFLFLAPGVFFHDRGLEPQPPEVREAYRR